jgi:hypothetical protein
MPSTLWSAPVGPLNSVSGTAVTTAVAAPGVDGAPTPQIIIQNGLLNVGTEIRIRAHGELTSTSATPTVIFSLVWNTPGTAIASGVVIAATAAQVINVAATGWPWMLEWDGEIRALSTSAGGNTGSVNGMGKFHSAFGASGSLTAFAAPSAFPTTKALRTVSIDTSINKAVQLGVTLSVTTGTPSVTVDDLIVELLG